jgi:spermidine synthase
LGLIRTGFLFGLANVGVALAMLAMLPRRGLRGEWLAGWLVAAALLAGLVWAERLERLAEVATYDAPVIHAVSTPYQRIALTREGSDLRLYLNGNLQFASRDEYRYHEALVHPVLGRVAQPRRVLVLGGGDGLAVREILKHPVGQVTLVDLDPAMTQLFGKSSLLTALNGGSLTDDRVRVINADAFQWLRAADGQYDAIIVDLPDPTNYSLGKLYSLSFYRELARVLAPGGVAVVQSTSPLIARRAYWTVATTLEAAGLTIRPYHAYVPSFGEWGFVLAGHGAISSHAERLPPGLRFWDDSTEAQALRFPADMARLPVAVNRLDNQALVRTFEAEWGQVTG